MKHLGYFGIIIFWNSRIPVELIDLNGGNQKKKFVIVFSIPEYYEKFFKIFNIA